MGRAHLEPVLLCVYGERQDARAGNKLHQRTEDTVKILTSYSVRLSPDCNRSGVFLDTVGKYRRVVDWFIAVIDAEWNSYVDCTNNQMAVNVTERLCVRSRCNPSPKYDFSADFYKFPSYLRRAAIAEAFGLVSSYRSNLDSWQRLSSCDRKKRPSPPKAGNVCPAMYRDNCFVRTGTYSARIKVWIRNTWDWIEVKLRKTDVDYILKRCSTRKECVPVLRRRGKVWSLDFSFEEKISLSEQNDIENTRILSVDLGINNACTCSVMQSDGAVAGRRFLRLPAEYDRLEHALDKIKRAQRVGARRMPKLWARARGVNDDIAVKTAQFIVDVAMEYSVDVIVMEALELQGRKQGSKRQRLHHWRAQYVQSVVGNKAHRAGIRISRVCAWNTSRLAFDGSGKVLRGRELAEIIRSEHQANDIPLQSCKRAHKAKVSYSICRFTTGKVYNCDLNASYNIGARYYIREILRSQSAKTRSALEAKVPSVSHRSTCTLSDLKDLRAALVA